MPAEVGSPGAAKLLRVADEIIAMAQDLQARGLAGEAVTFALIAAQYLQAARALQDLQMIA
jgi:sulfur transfer complex TusBCD TusB component (DsrH family)